MKRPSEKTKRIILLITGLCCLAVFCVSVFMVISRLTQGRKEEKAFENLAAQLPERTPRPSATRPPETSGVSNPSEPSSATEPSEPSGTTGSTERNDGTSHVIPLLPENGYFQEDDEPTPPTETDRYDALYEQNNDLFGWICVEDTPVNYPVMYTPDAPEHYLHRAFDGSYSFSGVPFLSGSCYTGCGNYIVYGHHMTNGTMFAGLMNYASKSWWSQHPTIQFDTLDTLGDYQVLSAFYTQVYHANEEGVFKYYAYGELTDQATFDEFVRQARESSLYDTGVEANFGDQLLTLITCNDHTKNGRFVVIARLAQTPEPSDQAPDGPEAQADEQ